MVGRALTAACWDTPAESVAADMLPVHYRRRAFALQCATVTAEGGSTYNDFHGHVQLKKAL
jgi:hypothetical protein